MIGLLGEGIISYVSPAHSEKLLIPMVNLLGRKGAMNSGINN